MFSVKNTFYSLFSLFVNSHNLAYNNNNNNNNNINNNDNIYIYIYRERERETGWGRVRDLSLRVSQWRNG